VRAYWLAPWRHHHYFPHTGKRPVIGRAENLSAKRSAPQPAKTFQRSWSTASALLSEPPRGRVRPLDAEPAPRMELPRQIPGPLK
jgi:plasmid stabilization system protein ParE